jgi:polysaccharide export outer membrane protein
MIRYVSGLTVAVLLPALLQAQTSAYQLFQRQQMQTQQPASPDPGDCIDCPSASEGDTQTAPPTDGRNSSEASKYRYSVPTYRDGYPKYGADRDPRENEMSKPVAPELPTEFQRFVQSSTGRLLPIFGSTLFDRMPSTFALTDRVPTNADYLVGPRDEIELRVWGQVNFSERFTVDPAGDIFLPQAGRVSVSGVKFAQLRDVLHSALGRIYRNFDLNVNMGQLRSMQIFVLGQARRPGTYMVSSLSTLVNALFASGGPSSRGSLRNVQLKRGGKVVTNMDLYDLLLQGDKTKDVPLLSGDIIFIPDCGPRVAVEGSVATPAIYELTPDTTLGDVVSYAGGLSPTAAGQRAIVERIDKRAALHSEDVELTRTGLATHPASGDIIRILSVVPRFERTVSLRGNVADPVRMAWRSGMKISDLIPNKESLLTRGYWHQHNELLNQDDREATGSGKSADVTASSNGEKLTEGSRPYREEARNTAADTSLAAATEKSDALPVRDFLRKNDVQPMAPDIDWHYAAIERLDLRELTTRVIPFDLGKVIIDRDPAADMLLEAGDVVTVFSSADITVPRAQQTKYVRIEGEVKMAGVYSVSPGETLHDMVTRAGGLTPHAYLFGALFTRESTRKEQQRRYSDFLDQLESDINQSAATLSGRIVSAQQAGSADSTVANERSLVARLRQTSATGRIVLDLEPGSQGVDALPKLPLENGDRLLVPSVPSTVNVVGMVYNQAAFLYASDLRLGDYLQDAGGPSRYADRAREFVIRADGSVVAREMRSRLFSSNFDSLRMYPGDTLVMPTNVSKTTLLRSLIDWSQVIANFGLGAAAINVLK